jgi:hypothetical protein
MTTFTPIVIEEGLGGWGDSWDEYWGEEGYTPITDL